jgi:flagellar protein FliJ
MAKPSPFELLIDYAKHQRDARSRALSVALGVESSATSRLQQLTDYRRDYLASYKKATGRGLSIAALQNYREFLARLEHAIHQQEAACEMTRADSIRSRTDLIHSEQRRHSIVTLNQRRLTEAQRRENRSEQRANDEAAATVALRTDRRDT